ncbi:CBS domain-containing protein, partial [Streptomyces klenkii]
ASTLLYLKAAGPVIRVFDASANRLLRRLGIEPLEELHHGATLEELGHLIGDSHERGQLPHATAELLDHALGFSERTLAEVMVPRVDVASVRASEPASEVVGLISTYGHSHYLVIGDRVDDIVGVVGVRELMRVAPERVTRRTAGALARRPLLLPDTLPLPGAVEQMQAADEEFAVVLDEYGGLAGIVTLEDIAEELVGEIADESDLVVEWAVRDGGGWLLDAGRRVDEVAQATGVPLPEDDAFETVAGLVIDRAGRFPQAGDVIEVDLGEGAVARLEVLSLDRRVPARIRLATATATAAAGAGARVSAPAQRGAEAPAAGEPVRERMIPAPEARAGAREQQVREREGQPS